MFIKFFSSKHQETKVEPYQEGKSGTRMELYVI